MNINNIKTLHETKFVSLKRAEYSNRKGMVLRWDYISRTNGQNVVSIIAKCPTTGKVLLLKEFRVPVNKWVIEFPKGLIEVDESAEDAAIRELLEETGYEGKVTRIHQFLSANPYLTNELTTLAEMEIDDPTPGRTNLEETEEIYSFWISREEFAEKYLKEDKRNKDIIFEMPVLTFFLEAIGA